MKRAQLIANIICLVILGYLAFYDEQEHPNDDLKPMQQSNY